MLLCVCLSPQLRWSLGANRGGVIDVAAVTHRVSAAVTGHLPTCATHVASADP